MEAWVCLYLGVKTLRTVEASGSKLKKQSRTRQSLIDLIREMAHPQKFVVLTTETCFEFFFLGSQKMLDHVSSRLGTKNRNGNRWKPRKSVPKQLLRFGAKKVLSNWNEQILMCLLKQIKMDKVLNFTRRLRNREKQESFYLRVTSLYIKDTSKLI